MTVGASDQLQETSSALRARRMPVKPVVQDVVSLPAPTYARLLSLADQAPLEGLALSPRTVASARTLGYNHIGQIRSTPRARLLAELGEELADELQRALQDSGLSEREAGGA